MTLAPLLAAIGVGLLIYQWARARPLWLDEEMIAINLRGRDLAELAGPLWLGQSAPLGWLGLQRIALIGFGTSELALRAVPVLFGIATLVAACWLGRRWMNPLGAAVLLALCGTGQWLSFYALELKPYSADAFWALFLPGLAAWAADGQTPTSRRRRANLWWAVAATGLWFANGALLVAPACALVLIRALVRRDGWRVAPNVALPGLGWLALFGLQYLLALRHTSGSEYLQAYWAFAFPPEGAGVDETLRWLTTELKSLAFKPGGSGSWVLFWLVPVVGFTLAMQARPALGLVHAAVPLSAFAFAAFRLVPLYERVSLWIVPALYVGIAFAADQAVRRGREAYARARWPALALALVGGLAIVQVGCDIVRRGVESLAYLPRASNHQLDDRSAVGWLMAERQPGDVLMGTRLSLPALWWYGGHTDPEETRSIFEARYVQRGSDCSPGRLREAFGDHVRVLVYLGFRFDDVPAGFDDLLFDRLTAIGAISAYREFAESGRAAVIDLRAPGTARPTFPSRPGARLRHLLTRPDGCIEVQQARRW